MKRTIYIAGLVLSVLAFGGFAVLAAWGGITRGHLNSKGWLVLVGNPLICWIVFGELRIQFRRGRSQKTAVRKAS
jgi:hypothetical protein